MKMVKFSCIQSNKYKYRIKKVCLHNWIFFHRSLSSIINKSRWRNCFPRWRPHFAFLYVKANQWVSDVNTVFDWPHFFFQMPAFHYQFSTPSLYCFLYLSPLIHLYMSFWCSARLSLGSSSFLPLHLLVLVTVFWIWNCSSAICSTL